MKLSQKNAEYREELKALSLELDQALQKLGRNPQSTNDNALVAETLQKKISILEGEIKQLKVKSPRNQVSFKLKLEEKVKGLKDRIKVCQNANKELKRKIEENHRAMGKNEGNGMERLLAELRTAQEKLRKAEENYSHERMNYEQTLSEIEGLEAKLSILNTNKVDLLKIESRNASEMLGNIEELKSAALGLEAQKKTIQASSLTEAEQLSKSIKYYEERIETNKKELKSLEHELKLKDFEINELKRKMRSTSARRFANTPDIGDFRVYDDEAPKENTEEKERKMITVRSEFKIGNVVQKPPRADSSSPAAKRMIQLQSEIAKAKSKVDAIQRIGKMRVD
jgi:DNA repair exonuclease SbcCD ATPase subunit